MLLDNLNAFCDLKDTQLTQTHPILDNLNAFSSDLKVSPQTYLMLGRHKLAHSKKLAQGRK